VRLVYEKSGTVREFEQVGDPLLSPSLRRRGKQGGAFAPRKHKQDTKMNTVQIEGIAARVKLCALNTGAWRATRLHRNETQIVNAAHHTTDAAKVHVKLTNSPALHALNKLHAAAYDAHKTLTLPTIQDGFRIIPAGREFEHSRKMQEFASRHNELRDQFIVEYDADKATAPARLNGLFDPSHWPDVSTVAERFTFATRYLPCPSAGAWGDWLAESATAAEDELRERLTEALSRVASRCASDGKLYDTVFSNLAEVIALVPDLNITQSPKLAEAAKLAQELAGLSADTIRENKTARKTAADRASQILAAMGAQ